eukprot:CAMPEP_0184862870 /NCGR_PEP_ID=MMETSP0580-20130426/8123_1 /TAXON_ID=1118495 /ORGANISM="Dactyliosolen fragilissimus" /LENGTH=179 /DNA_ID=CAMNT_0027360887 /DNA_START=270 /DNA_END=809 /DNA_ORIENTATION=-
MGDSITEGTIVEWTVDIGQAVKEGDVVALIETDKVTVDIKADMNGVISNRFGSVDDTVEVGSDLYQIDTDGVPSLQSLSEDIGENATITAAGEQQPDASATTTISDATQPHRIPSIKFLGKEGWALRRSPKPIIQADHPTTHNVTVERVELGLMYGRLPFTEKEMDALIMGGAIDDSDY